MNKYKIMIFAVRGTGHLNPLLPILKELNRTNQVDVIVYGPENFRFGIESTGAQFRNYFDDESEWNAIREFEKKGETEKKLFNLIEILLSLAPKNMFYLSNEINKEQPDIIIYDFLALYMPKVLEFYQMCYETKRNLTSEKNSYPKKPLPNVIIFSPSFSFKQNLYPNKSELVYFPMSKYGLSTLWNTLKLIWIQFKICIRFGLSFSSAIKLGQFDPPKLVNYVLTVVLPELQPRSHLFDQNMYQFVGSTLDENLVDPKALNDEIFQKLLSQHTIRILDLPYNNNNKEETKSKLVYASLGTIFNYSFSIYKKIVDAFKEFDDESREYKHPSLRLSDLTVVVSTGEGVYLEFEKYMATNKYEIPKNIVLVKSAPQIEILKRASLFVTHNGMNSTSESVHFAVPMICIPISADQPLVAYRVADELGIGIRLDKNNLQSSHIRRAAHKILNDDSYQQRIKRFSEISRGSNGSKNATKFLMGLMEKKNL